MDFTGTGLDTQCLSGRDSWSTGIFVCENNYGSKWFLKTHGSCRQQEFVLNTWAGGLVPAHIRRHISRRVGNSTHPWLYIYSWPQTKRVLLLRVSSDIRWFWIFFGQLGLILRERLTTKGNRSWSIRKILCWDSLYRILSNYPPSLRIWVCRWARTVSYVNLHSQDRTCKPPSHSRRKYPLSLSTDEIVL